MLMRKLFSIPVLLVLTFFTQFVFATNGMVPHGFGTKSKGMAGAGTALPQGPMINAVNPAGVSWVKPGWDAGVAVFSPWREATDLAGAGGFVATGNYESESNFFLVPYWGAVWNWKSGYKVGVAVYGAGGMNSDYPTLQWNPSSGPGTGIDLKQLFVAPTVSKKVSPTTSVGVSPIFAMQAFEARGLDGFAGFTRTGTNTNLTNNGTDIAYGFGLRAGFLTKLSDAVSIGGSYTTKVRMTEFDDYSNLFAERGRLDYPPILNLGIAWKMTDSSVLVFDIQHIWYSQVPSIGNSATRLFNCPAFMGADPESCFGGNNGPGFAWKDMTVYKLGYQWRASGYTWRVGYSYGKNPVSEASLNILAPGVVEHHFTFGFTKKTGKNSEFNFAMMYAPESSFTRASVLGQDDNVELKMYQFDVEVSWSKKF